MVVIALNSGVVEGLFFLLLELIFVRLVVHDAHDHLLYLSRYDHVYRRRRVVTVNSKSLINSVTGWNLRRSEGIAKVLASAVNVAILAALTFSTVGITVQEPVSEEMLYVHNETDWGPADLLQFYAYIDGSRAGLRSTYRGRMALATTMCRKFDLVTLETYRLVCGETVCRSAFKENRGNLAEMWRYHSCLDGSGDKTRGVLYEIKDVLIASNVAKSSVSQWRNFTTLSVMQVEGQEVRVENFEAVSNITHLDGEVEEMNASCIRQWTSMYRDIALSRCIHESAMTGLVYLSDTFDSLSFSTSTVVYGAAPVSVGDDSDRKRRDYAKVLVLSMVEPSVGFETLWITSQLDIREGMIEVRFQDKQVTQIPSAILYILAIYVGMLTFSNIFLRVMVQRVGNFNVAIGEWNFLSILHSECVSSDNCTMPSIETVEFGVLKDRPHFGVMRATRETGDWPLSQLRGEVPMATEPMPDPRAVARG